MPEHEAVRRRGGAGSGGLQEPLLVDAQRDAEAEHEYEESPKQKSGACDIGGVLGGLMAGCARAVLSLARSLGLLPVAPPPPLTPQQQAAMARLYHRTTLPYLTQNESHRRLLLRLWSLCFPESGTGANGQLPPPPLEDPRDDRWKEVGWQNRDPAGDFRAGGVQALAHLIAMAETKATTFQALRHKSRGVRSEWEYPFCAAGVNVTFALTQMLKLRDPPTFSSSSSSASSAAASPVCRAFLRYACPVTSATSSVDAPEWETEIEDGQWGPENEVLDTLYAATWEVLDAEWLERKASYMEFPKVLEAALARIENLLCSNRFQTVGQLYEHVRTHPLQ